MRLLIALGFIVRKSRLTWTPGTSNVIGGMRASLALLRRVPWPGLSTGANASRRKYPLTRGLSYALNLPGAEIIYENASPLGQLSVVRSPEMPFRHAPGLSLNSPQSRRQSNSACSSTVIP